MPPMLSASRTASSSIQEPLVDTHLPSTSLPMRGATRKKHKEVTFFFPSLSIDSFCFGCFFLFCFYGANRHTYSNGVGLNCVVSIASACSSGLRSCFGSGSISAPKILTLVPTRLKPRKASLSMKVRAQLIFLFVPFRCIFLAR
jgi:hypothetical protein